MEDSTTIKQKRSAIVISASSDIGTAMCYRWKSEGWNVFGTYLTKSQAVAKLEDLGVCPVHCDLLDSQSVENACVKLRDLCPQWDVIVMATGTQMPVGPFMTCDFNQWDDSIKVNFTNQLRIVHEMLPTRNLKNRMGPCVLFFSGGGTNNAVLNYSAYTISKIALIKMCELLDAEIPDTRFAIIGPGWVKTKIHESTLKAGQRAGNNYALTVNKLDSNECTPIEQVLDCCDWIVNTRHEVISGRNFSVVFDMWGTKELEKKLLENNDMYKLRRFGNNWFVRKK
jgi:NAD(P)-dependent dehydrogenase (short-subunit alcohol dehydrogenase family)